MASLLELLCAYPVLENLVTVLPLGDLFNVSWILHWQIPQKFILALRNASSSVH